MTLTCKNLAKALKDAPKNALLVALPPSGEEIPIAPGYLNGWIYNDSLFLPTDTDGEQTCEKVLKDLEASKNLPVYIVHDDKKYDLTVIVIDEEDNTVALKCTNGTKIPGILEDILSLLFSAAKEHLPEVLGQTPRTYSDDEEGDIDADDDEDVGEEEGVADKD